MSIAMQKEVIRHLVRDGGTDVVIVDGRIYELSVRELDIETVRQAVSNLMEEQAHEQG